MNHTPPRPLPPEALRWRCPSEPLRFATTREVDPAPGVLGQENAVGALRFGLRVEGRGQNIFVRGLTGTGRLTLVRELLQAVPLAHPPASDRLYVHNFEHPDQPRLLSVPTGKGRLLKLRMDELIRFIRDDLEALVETQRLATRSREISSVSEREMATISDPFEARLKEAGLALAQLEDDEGAVVIPLVNGEPQPLDSIEGLEPEAREALRTAIDVFSIELRGVATKILRIRKRAEQQIRRVTEEETRAVLADAVADLRRDFPDAVAWLGELLDDVARTLPRVESEPGLLDRYRVNLLASFEPEGPRPVVVETVPSVQSLVGSVDPLPADGPGVVMHLGIHAGSLLRADGGCLVLDARDLLEEPGAWQALNRTLRSGLLELTPADTQGTTQRAPGVKPEPVPVRVKVVLIGDPFVYAALDESFQDFRDLFKVLADFDDVIARDVVGIGTYARVVARFAHQEAMPHFTASAVQALVEHGARLGSEKGKLTARFGLVADVAREAAYQARSRRAQQVDRFDVEQAVYEARQRAGLPGRRFREHIANGTVRVDARGEVVGQVNGLAVADDGPMAHGFPLRITATIGPGTAGAIHVEREADLSGQIHTKGFYILRGLLRHLLATSRPLMFDASITHEQSYAGVDGDSASGAELCCLFSALTGRPARQSLAMTGAIDQLGNIEPIGAVNEKIEGWYDATVALGVAEGCGVIVPAANIGDLMLRTDVVEACRAGGFAVYGVAHVRDALELLLGAPADRLLAEASSRAEALWASSAPPQRVG